MEPLGERIPQKGDELGTVAFVQLGERPVFGVNSSALVRDVDKNLGRAWRDKLGWGPFQGQSAFHAEGHALMRAYEMTGGKLPSEIAMYVDRATCARCQTGLGKHCKSLAFS